MVAAWILPWKWCIVTGGGCGEKNFDKKVFTTTYEHSCYIFMVNYYKLDSEIIIVNCFK